MTGTPPRFARAAGAGAAITGSARLADISDGLRPDDRRAVHQTALRQGVVADRKVHRAGIVPHDEIADPPAVAIAKFGPDAMGVKRGDHTERSGVPCRS